MIKWLRERQEIKQYEQEIRDIEDQCIPDREAFKDFDENSKNEIVSGMFSLWQAPREGIELIRTARRLRSAHFYDIPLPRREQGSEYWEIDWGAQWTFTQKGHQLIRREVATERELITKPWLPIAAIIISIISLAINFVK